MTLTECKICDNRYAVTIYHHHCPVCSTLAIKVNGQHVTWPDLKVIGRAFQSDYAFKVTAQ